MLRKQIARFQTTGTGLFVYEAFRYLGKFSRKPMVKLESQSNTN
jgi:hypothetical protein